MQLGKGTWFNVATQGYTYEVWSHVNRHSEAEGDVPMEVRSILPIS